MMPKLLPSIRLMYFNVEMAYKTFLNTRLMVVALVLYFNLSINQK
jgi:hypothetical protein